MHPYGSTHQNGFLDAVQGALRIRNLRQKTPTTVGSRSSTDCGVFPAPSCLLLDVVEEVYGRLQIVGPDDGEPSPRRPLSHLHQAVNALKPALPRTRAALAVLES